MSSDGETAASASQGGDRNVDEIPPIGDAALHQLPPPPAEFIGRETELAELETASASQDIYISGLRGMGGVGKTALALVLAHRLAPRFPDAQFYLDLRGDSLRPLSAAQAMAHVIRAYHPTTHLPEDQDELADLYRAVLDGQHALLLMDNAARRSQVEPLQPPRTCLLVVTSRRRFGLPGLRVLDLHALPFEDAEDLLLRIAPRLRPPPSTAATGRPYRGNQDGAAGPSGRMHEEGEEAPVLKTAPLLRPSSAVDQGEEEDLLREPSPRVNLPGPGDGLHEEQEVEPWHMTRPLVRPPGSEGGSHGGQDIESMRKTRPLVSPPLRQQSDVQGSEDGPREGQEAEPWRMTRPLIRPHPLAEAAGHLSQWEQEDDPGPEASSHGENRHAGPTAVADTGGALTELAHLCGCLPLALRLVASALAERQDLELDQVLERLWKGQAQQEPVKASLHLSYDLLSEDLQQRWCALAVFSGTLNRTAAASVWGVESRAADDMLDSLLRYSLIECDAQTRRYYLHDLARQCAGTWLDDRERAMAEQRHALHYAWILDMANKFYLKGEEGELRGLALYDREQANVKAGQAWAAAYAGRNREATRLCSAYPTAGAYILDVRLRAQEQIRWLETAADAAHQLGDRRGEGIHLGNTGNAYSDLGEAEMAIDYYKRALDIARETEDRRNEGAWLGNTGNVYRNLGKVKMAIDYYERALAIARETGDRRDQGNALSHLGLAYAARRDVKKAIEYTQSALEIFEDIQSPHVEKTREQLARLRQQSSKKWWQFWK